MHKYHAKKAVCLQGHTHDSRAGTAEDKLDIALRMLSLMTGENVTERVERREMERYREVQEEMEVPRDPEETE